jgi:hypothetical protein
MRFVADESVDLPTVQAIREAGYDVTYVAELAPGIDDATVLYQSRSQSSLIARQALQRLPYPIPTH